MAGPFHQGADGWKNFTGAQMAGGFSSGCIWLEAFQLGADSLEHLSRGQMAKEVPRGANNLENLARGHMCGGISPWGQKDLSTLPGGR